MLQGVLLPTYVQMSGALSAWLDKAQAQISDDGAEALLLARIARDMFPLFTQAHFACKFSSWAVVHLLVYSGVQRRYASNRS